MLRTRLLASRALPTWRSRPCFSRSHAQRAAASEPLHILFCGSDDFSCASLRVLHDEHQRNPLLVEALEVMVLPPKWTGRGYKQLRDVPCKGFAKELGLHIHERPTFTGWQLPFWTNLVVVVSFGLFVPPRILREAKYGGLNVHPSLLPDLRGPAPIHRALLRGDEHLGISLQTLDDERFDHGVVLVQTPRPGYFVRPDLSIQQITRDLGTMGGEMLVEGLRNGLHISPHKDNGWKAAELAGRELEHAFKISKADAEIDWQRWQSPEDFTRRIRVCPPIWTQAVCKRDEPKRILFPSVEPAEVPQDMQSTHHLVALPAQDAEAEWGIKVPALLEEGSGACLFQLRGGRWIRVERAKVEGKEEQKAAHALQHALRT